MAKYGASFPSFGTTTSLKTGIGIDTGAAATVAAEIVELIATGSGSVTPADIAHRATVLLYTAGAAGTSTAFVPVPSDQTTANAAKVVVGVNFSAEPTTMDAGTLSGLLWGFNQRGGMRYGVPQGEGVKLRGQAAARGRALSFSIISSAAGNVDLTGQWWES